MGKKVVILWFGVIVFLGFLFQNCGQNEVSFDQSASSENPFGFGYVRFLEIDPNLAKNRPPIHLTTIMDNSYSTQQIHTDIVSGFTNAIDQVKGFNVEASLYTTSHSDDKSSTKAEKFYVYQDDKGNDVKLSPEDKDLIPPNTNYVEKESFRIADSWFEGRKNLKYEFSKDDFQDFKDRYTASVANLGTDGADKEQGLCTLLKKAYESNKYDDPNNSAYHLYVLATNEDDATSFDSCVFETSQETQFVGDSKTESCSPGSADCVFKARVEQEDDIIKQKKLNYTYQDNSVKLDFKGHRIREWVKGTKQIGDNSIRFEKKVASINFKVDKYCYRDNIKEPCGNATVKPVQVAGSCSNGSSYTSCDSNELLEAAKAFGISPSEVHSCQVKCDSNFVSENLAKSRVPNQDVLCPVDQDSETNCDNEDLQAVLNATSLNSSEIRNCKKTCGTDTESVSRTYWNEKSSCSSSSSCSEEHKGRMASLLKVDKSQITCNYSCKPDEINKEINWSSSKSCSQLPDSCGSREWDEIARRFRIESEDIESCQVKCDSRPVNDSLTINLGAGESCTNSSSCSGDMDSVEADARGPVISCSRSCEDKSVSRPSCTVSNLTDVNFCSNNTEIARRCSGIESDKIKYGSCRLLQGTRETGTIKKQTLAKQKSSIGELVGANSENELPRAVANKLMEIHGKNGFFTSFFIHPSNDPTCQAPPSLSAGRRYEELVSVLGSNNSQSFPVCLDDYSPALDKVVQVAIENVLTTFNLDLKEGESVIEVKATFLDDTTEVVPKSEYEVFKNSIFFKNREILKDIKGFEFKVWGP